ncbi:hypothetical protein DSO57_1002614 [Entomophthora muscae]|uniref:Uncharacterized protein n=1 Tax=Entomophthora muscae TaxID=34485 RepID=A0ACC2U6Z2_9FUNG|nr:hypothetical protein DSO57_1002614 [Entomophthora muscae]
MQFPGNLPPPAEMIPETRKIKCEPIYAADSLTLSQMKVFLISLYFTLTSDQPPKFYCPPGAPFGLVHFTEYPPNPVYLEFTLEKILFYDPEARTRETETVYREGTKITIPPLLFRNKYNYLPTYLVPMTPPLTLRPNHLQESIGPMNPLPLRYLE